MKIDYFAFKYVGNRLRKLINFAFVAFFMLSLSSTYAQTITIQTVSSLNPWTVLYANPGAPLTWDATGAVVQSRSGTNFVDFDFSSNGGSGIINVATTGTVAQFNGISQFIANGCRDFSRELCRSTNFFN